MIGWIEHHGVETLVCYIIFVAIQGGMPTPADNSSVGYRWIFGTFSILSVSFARLIATQFPASKLGQSLQGAQPVQPVVVAEVVKDKQEAP